MCESHFDVTLDQTTKVLEGDSKQFVILDTHTYILLPWSQTKNPALTLVCFKKILIST